MSLFKKPAWAQERLSDDDDEETSKTNLFSHSNSYGDIVAEQERRKREKAERKRAKAERRTSGKREVKDEPTDQNTPKRRRITSEESEKLLKSVGITARLEKDDFDEPVVDGTPVRRSPRKQRQTRQAGRPPSRADVIDLGGSSDEAGDEAVQTIPGASRAEPAAPVENVPDDSDDSDDEFAELARMARQQRLQTQNRSSHTPNPGGPSPRPGLGTSYNTNHDRPPDPTIQLLITSPLPGTNPLIVHRKLSQPTAAIRHAWCQKQGFSKEYAESVFFIHRMRRVYDVTTCRSLGLEADEFGHVTMRGAEGKEGVEKVHLEAVTEEVFKEMKENKEKEAQARSGDVPAVEENEGESAQEESLIRLVLKAKGQSDFRLKVKSVSVVTTTCGRGVLTRRTEHTHIPNRLGLREKRTQGHITAGAPRIRRRGPQSRRRSAGHGD